ncbi:MAG: hypothetical protein V4773_10780 [Verrucomicrobiota bacterium]
MTQRVFVGGLTVVVFLAGYFTRAYTTRAEPVPPPPPALTRELAPQGAQKADDKAKHDLDRAKMVEDIKRLRPQIDAYIAQVHEIDGEFDREFNAVLNPKQREKRKAYMQARAEKEAKRIADREPLSDEALQRERERPLTGIYGMITVTPRLELLTKEYELTEEQQIRTRALLSVRRSKFIALFDATPHPSLRLSRLAPIIERVAAPLPTAAPAPAKK